VRGIPGPNAVFEAQIDATGRLEQLIQDGWTIRYTRYHPAAGGRWPARLSLAREDISVRLLIDKWQFEQLPVALP
jgi:outer membrane lipoprotein LolB